MDQAGLIGSEGPPSSCWVCWYCHSERCVRDQFHGSMPISPQVEAAVRTGSSYRKLKIRSDPCSTTGKTILGPAPGLTSGFRVAQPNQPPPSHPNFLLMPMKK